MARFIWQKKRIVRSCRYSLSISSILWFFLLIWYFEPQYFREDFIPLVHNIFVLGRIGSALIICGIIFFKMIRFKDYKPSALYIYILFEESILIISSILNPDANKIFQVLIDNVLLIMPFLGGIDYLFQKKPVKIINILLLISEILLYCNFISMILFPNGLYNITIGSTRKYYLLGQQNLTILYIMIGLVTSLLQSQYVTKKRFSIRTFVLFTVCVYMEIVIKSATGFVGLLIFVGIFLLTEFKHIVIDLRWGMLVSAVIFFVFIVFERQEIFSTIIIDILHRDITASTRTIIWEKALQYILQKPLLGFGVEANEIAILRFGYITPHNRCLYMMYRGGIILLSAFIVMIFRSGQKLSIFKFERASVYITSALFALIIQMQFESYDTSIFYILFIMAFHVKDILIATEGRKCSGL